MSLLNWLSSEGFELVVRCLWVHIPVSTMLGPCAQLLTLQCADVSYLSQKLLCVKKHQPNEWIYNEEYNASWITTSPGRGEETQEHHTLDKHSFVCCNIINRKILTCSSNILKSNYITHFLINTVLFSIHTSGILVRTLSSWMRAQHLSVLHTLIYSFPLHTCLSMCVCTLLHCIHRKACIHVDTHN